MCACKGPEAECSVGIAPGVAEYRRDRLGKDTDARLGNWAVPGQLQLLSSGQWESTEEIQNGCEQELGRGWFRRFLKDSQSGFQRLGKEYKNELGSFLSNCFSRSLRKRGS